MYTINSDIHTISMMLTKHTTNAIITGSMNVLVVPAAICTGTTSIHVQLYYTNTIYLHIYIYTNYNRCSDINPSLWLMVGGIFTTSKNCCLCSSLSYVTVTMACLCGAFEEAQCHVDDIKSNKCLCLSFSLYLKHFKQLDSP